MVIILIQTQSVNRRLLRYIKISGEDEKTFYWNWSFVSIADKQFL